MPGLHCHLPPDEEEKKFPGDELPVAVEMEVSDESDEGEVEAEAEAEAEIGDAEETENAEESEVSDEEGDDGSTSDEALSLINDTSVVPWVPVLTSSDEEDDVTEDQPTSTMAENDTEPMEFSTTVGHIRQQPARNVARRSRARCPGVNFVRRGRHRQPLSQQELVPVRPFDRGFTFNGFNRNLEPDRVHGFFHDIASDEILYRVSWRNSRNQSARPIEASLMRTFRPEMLVEFYEDLVTRNRFLNLHRL